jgi:hypothetical protein
MAGLLLAIAVAVPLGGCGSYRFDLSMNGKFPAELADVGTVELTVGEARRVITKVGSPSSWGYVPGLVSSNPNVVEIVHDDRGASIVAKSAGEARVASINVFAQRDWQTWDRLMEESHFDPARDSFIVRVGADDR